MADIRPLPKKGSKYWTRVDADVQIHNARQYPCEHEFASTNGNDVECSKCHIGFNLGTRGSLKDKHIYIDGKLVI